ncbi:hypothetical protein GLOIN_2v1667506 [Rhizophagus clarus]|uniref:Uncharacterized protein n=1 Tax=Rhizophagus clarus TaxID=94130 RepID=A0A8H3KZA9_9GLOM|nr:hypothetical protein GLOIN_2v1667506 [Rhizophagus clarus]
MNNQGILIPLMNETLCDKLLFLEEIRTMTGQSKKTETTSKRKSRSSQREMDKNITSLKNKKTNKSTRTSSDEVEELKRKISELQAENNELTKKNNHLQYQLDNYGNLPLSLVNEDNESQVEESDDSTPPAKRQMRKRPSEEDEKAKTLMKTLLKTFPELELNEKEIFTSQANNNTCIALVPELQKLMSEHKYNPSSEQLKAWLKSIHGTKRKAFLKSNPPNQQSNQSNKPIPSNQSPINDDSQETEKNTKEKKQSKPKNEIEDGAKSLMRRLLDNTYIQDEYKLKSDGPDADIRPMYELSYKQVESWLKSVHKPKRNAYIRSTRMEID